MRDIPRRNLVRTLISIGLPTPLAGCSTGGAPSFIVFGAYFPGWGMCFLVGVMGALATRTALVLTRLADTFPFQLGICISSGLIIGVAAWLIWFGR